MTSLITKTQLTELSGYILDNASFELNENDELGIFRTYSGRSMYGRECLGLTISGSEIFEIAMLIGEWLNRAVLDYELGSEFKSVSTDSMGRSIILYWPEISVAEDEETQEKPYPGTQAFERS